MKIRLFTIIFGLLCFPVLSQHLRVVFPNERADSVQMAYPKFHGMTQVLDNASSVLVKDIPYGWSVLLVGEEDNKRIFLNLTETDSGYFISILENIQPRFLRYELEDFFPETSGSCNVNIMCPEGMPHAELGESVVRIGIYVGSLFSYGSGVLVNNTAQDGKAYILTAEHNGLNFFSGAFATAANLANWEFDFNYQRPGCNNQQAPQGTISYTGCVLRMRSFDGGGETGSDVALMEISDAAFDSSIHRYAGWSRSTSAPASGFGIHHPAGDVKKISFFTAPAVAATYFNQPTPVHWRLSWSATQSGHGVTEPGSSGSPIFGLNNGLVLGTLTGGAASCNNRNAPDYYGMFWHQWDGNGSTANRQLKPWLDPLNTDPQQFQGKNLSVFNHDELITKYSIYPNPSNPDDKVFLPETESNNWLVFDLQGRLIMRVDNSNVLLAPQKSGTYIIKHQHENIRIPLIVN
jgi:hypothetical protein